MDKDKIIEVLKRENESLKKQRLELIMENAELKDMVLDNGGDYTKDFEVTKNIENNDFEVENNWIYESPDGKTIYRRKLGKDFDTKELIDDPSQLKLF
tara:strand:+ start:230 stop:523 length:294 start_codon:yes stop_codon:yes gene_type:complete